MEIGRCPVHYDYRRAAYVLRDFPRPKIVSVANVVKCDHVCVLLCLRTWRERSEPEEDRCYRWKMRVQEGFYGFENSFVVPQSVL